MAEGTEVGTAYVSIVPSAAGFGTKLEQQIVGQSGQAGDKAGKAMGAGITGQASTVAKSVAGVFAAVGAAKFLRGSLDEAQEAVKVGNLTNAVIKSTGGAAGVTAKQVDALAASLSKVAGIDDEVIQAGENVLLTFTSVRNQVGAGNDVFNQATAAALDMSAALGTDLQGSIIQLGKALNDPVQGMTALRRVGVSFTEQQIAQVKAMQDSNNLLGAQKIVLREVQREFGGAAAANATALDKLHVSVGNLEESLGTALLPAVNSAASGLSDMLGVFTALPGPIQSVSAALIGLGAASLALALLAPKIRAAKVELEGLRIAGVSAGGAMTVFGGALSVLSGAGITAIGLGALGRQLTNLTKGPSASVSELAGNLADLGQTGAITGDLAKQFGADLGGLAHELNQFTTPKIIQSLALLNPNLQDAKRDVKAVDQALAELVGNNRADLAAAAVDQLTAAIVAEGKDPALFTDRLTRYHDALGAVNLQARLTGAGIDQLGNDVSDASGLVGEAKQKWDDLHGAMEKVLQSDFSTKLASDLTSILNPLEKFVPQTTKNIDELKTTVTGASAELAKAKDDLAKLTVAPTQIADPVEAFLGGNKQAAGATAAQIDAAKAQVSKAAADLAAAQKKLAEAHKSPLASLKENLTANLKTVTDWQNNLARLAGRGTEGEALAKHLGALGPEAAGAVAEATHLSKGELDKLEALFAGADKRIGDAASGAFELSLDQAAKPGDTLAEIIAKRYEASLVPKFTKATLAALNAATTAILDAEKKATPPTPAQPAPALGPTVLPPLGPNDVSPEEFANRTRGWGGTTNNVTVNVAQPVPDPGLLGKAIAWEL